MEAVYLWRNDNFLHHGVIRHTVCITGDFSQSHFCPFVVMSSLRVRLAFIYLLSCYLLLKLRPTHPLVTNLPDVVRFCMHFVIYCNQWQLGQEK